MARHSICVANDTVSEQSCKTRGASALAAQVFEKYEQPKVVTRLESLGDECL